MLMKKLMFALLLFLLSGIVQAQTRTDDLPYLYYYSRMTGGIVIERVDGSDSRLIGTEAIPANHTGIAGPGWSPTGKYFAGYTVKYDYNVIRGEPFLIDTQGNNRLGNWLRISTHKMEWSPDTRDLLFIVGQYSSNDLHYFFWLSDPNNNLIMADLGISDIGYPLSISTVKWENNHIIFYVSRLDPRQEYFRITMYFDSRVVKEPVLQEEFSANYISPYGEGIGKFDLIHHGIAVSPSGRYETYDTYQATLTDYVNGTMVQLPKHSEQTSCRDYVWHPNEYYMIMLGGTIQAGGGCGGTVMGITSVDSRFWRELGGCSWDYPPCIGWLPPQVDVATMPPGQPETVLLTPVGFMLGNHEESYLVNVPPDMKATWQCAEDYATRYVYDLTNRILFLLQDIDACGYNYNNVTYDIVYTYNSQYQLLATSGIYYRTVIWQFCDDIGYPALKIDSSGYQLKFTPDGEYLYTRNYNAWRIYSVQDILEHAGDVCAGQPNH